MVTRPEHLNRYEFVAIAALRAKQLLAGCTPRISGDHTTATIAQMEVAGGLVVSGEREAPVEPVSR